MTWQRGSGKTINSVGHVWRQSGSDRQPGRSWRNHKESWLFLFKGASENYFSRFKGKSYIFQLSHWYCVCMSSWEHAPNMEPLQICVWLRCCGHWLLPFPINLRAHLYNSEISTRTLLWMLCHIKLTLFIWNALLPSDGMWRREREGEEGEEQGSERRRRREERWGTQRRRRLHKLSELRIALMT